jgi:putative membrane protein
MFINFVAIMLVNLAAATFLLALYVYLDLDDEARQKRWVPGFTMTGFIALATGLFMMWTWPLPGPHNIAFGEISVLLGTVLLGGAMALALSWDLVPMSIFAFFAGAAAVDVGVRIIALGLTRSPALAGAGYILTGGAGLLAPLMLYLRHSRLARTVAALMLLAATLIWAVIGYGAYWGHLSDFAQWVPPIMRQ